MTTRDQVKRAVGVDRGEIARGGASDYGPNLPERLLTARERKGVDLYRAERDTKIRARYLAALERGDWKELPGAVYTKGFLRNYALYLGLDPDDVLLQWRRERPDGRETEPVIVVPRPIVAPRKGLTFSPTVVVAAIMTVLLVVFAGYVVMQLARFVEPPTITVTEPRTAVIDVDESATSYTLRGESLAGATITIVAPGWDQPYRVSANADGRWSAEVELRRGENQFEISATDPDTQKVSEETRQVIITVPFRTIEAPTLTVDQPAEGATFENGAIPVQGTTTNSKEVVVSATFLGPPGSTATPAPGASAGPSPTPVTVAVGDDGTYSTPFELTAGRWSLTVTASSPEGKTASLTRNVTVDFEGINLVLKIKGGRAWVKVWVDGKIDPRLGAAGDVLSNGKTLTFQAKESIEVRTGNSGVTQFTLNGVSLGALGKSGVPETWLFEPPNDPVLTSRR